MMTRSGSAHGCDAAQRPVRSTSSNAWRRPRPLSASSNARPNPDDPRTLGSTHAYPCPVKNAEYQAHLIRELPAGPPWEQTITGSFPARFLRGERWTGTARPSDALIEVMLVSVGGNVASEGRASFRKGATLPVFASIAHASLGERGVDQSTTRR